MVFIKTIQRFKSVKNVLIEPELSLEFQVVAQSCISHFFLIQSPSRLFVDNFTLALPVITPSPPPGG